MSNETKGRIKWGVFGVLSVIGVVGMAGFEDRFERLAFGLGWLYFWTVFICGLTLFRNGKA